MGWRAILRAFATEFGLLFVIGFVVAIAMLPVIHLRPIRLLDLGFSDILMRQITREELADAKSQGPRFVFVDVGDESCEQWAKASGTICTSSLRIPRNHLAKLIGAMRDAFAHGGREPRLLLLDIELAPLPNGQAGDDADLCNQVAQISRDTPVMGLRPLVRKATAQGPVIDGLWRAIGDICRLFKPTECENFFKAAGYGYV